MGKTTLSKKMAWDWARNSFDRFDLVLVVFLKFVREDETIETAIVNQNRWMEELGISRQKLRKVLEQFSDRCLLILDGLDEHSLGANKDVLRIVQREKLLNCSLLLTSRPHSTADIETHFQPIARVEGFTKTWLWSSRQRFSKTQKK